MYKNNIFNFNNNENMYLKIMFIVYNICTKNKLYEKSKRNKN